MKAIRVHAYGQPPQADDVPEPEAPGPDDVVVRIGGAGLCRTDLHIADGWFADVIPADLPLVLGHENAGWVHAVGPAVEHLAVGDPVICHPNLTCGVCRPCRVGDDMRCTRGPNLPGLMCAGGMAELFKTRARAVVKLPAGAAPAEVAALADAGLTAYHAVAKAVPALGAGSSAVVVGAGGLGHIGIQCLKAMTPASVIAVDTSEEARKLATTWGADHVVGADGQQAQQVRDLTGPGADAVFDFVGEDSTIGDSVAMLRSGGTYYLVGYGGTVTLPTLPLVLGEITVAANLIGTYADLADLVTLAAQGQVTLHSSRYPLEAAADAIEDLRCGRVRGRAVLVPLPVRRDVAGGDQQQQEGDEDRGDQGGRRGGQPGRPARRGRGQQPLDAGEGVGPAGRERGRLGAGLGQDDQRGREVVSREVIRRVTADGGVIGGHLRQRGQLSGRPGEQRHETERAAQRRGPGEHGVVVPAQVRPLVRQHGLQLPGVQHGQRPGRDDRAGPAGQAVGGGSVLVEDDRAQRGVRAARRHQERGVCVPLAPAPRYRAAQAPPGPRHDRGGQQQPGHGRGRRARCRETRPRHPVGRGPRQGERHRHGHGGQHGGRDAGRGQRQPRRHGQPGRVRGPAPAQQGRGAEARRGAVPGEQHRAAHRGPSRVSGAFGPVAARPVSRR